MTDGVGGTMSDPLDLGALTTVWKSPSGEPFADRIFSPSRGCRIAVPVGASSLVPPPALPPAGVA